MESSHQTPRGGTVTPEERKVTELAEECATAAAKERRAEHAAYYNGYAKGLLQALNYLTQARNTA